MLGAHTASSLLATGDRGFFEGQDGAAVDYKVTGERVWQNVRSLTSRQDQIGSVQGLVEAVEAIREGDMQLEVPASLLFQERIDWDLVNALALGFHEDHQSTAYPLWRK